MIPRAALVVALLIVSTGCTDRYRNPCEATTPTTTTIVRTKNKAFGWIPPSTVFYQSPVGSPLFPRIIEKCA